jgi:hypothetical protein
MLPFGTSMEDVNAIFWEFVALGRRELPSDVLGAASSDRPSAEISPASVAGVAGVEGGEVCSCRHWAGQNFRLVSSCSL